MADIANVYRADGGRYGTMAYNRVGQSGLRFPAVSLGFGTTSAPTVTMTS